MKHNKAAKVSTIARGVSTTPALSSVAINNSTRTISGESVDVSFKFSVLVDVLLVSVSWFLTGSGTLEALTVALVSSSIAAKNVITTAGDAEMVTVVVIRVGVDVGGVGNSPPVVVVVDVDSVVV